LGYEDKFAPRLHGFDYAWYALGGGLDYFHHVELPESGAVHHVLRCNGQPVQRDGYFTDLVSDEAVRYIRQHAAERFFLYVAYTAPHAPYQGPQDFTPQPLPRESPLQDQSRGPRATYVAMIERLDQGVGQILQALHDEGLADHTVVIFTSDNGATKSGSNGLLAGYKGSTFEGGIRVPAMVRWPAKIAPGLVSEQACITMDFSRSIVRLAGAAPPPGRTFDGMDILERIEAGRPVEPRLLVWRQRRGDNTWWAVRDGSLKLIRRAKGAVLEEHLFDVAQDPGEQQDLRASRADDVQRLAARLAHWEDDVQPARGR
jgi:N-acetylgalactosamine-6-sulfatase